MINAAHNRPIDRLSDGQRAVIEKYQGSLPDAPIKIYALARELGCRIFEADMARNISGAVMYNEKEEVFDIYLNNNEAKARLRFTCAHELAHRLLHEEDIRKKPVAESIMLRSNLSNAKEVEANSLAADILMPMAMVNQLAETRQYGFDELAKKFGVSRQAMLVRLGIPDYKLSDIVGDIHAAEGN